MRNGNFYIEYDEGFIVLFDEDIILDKYKIRLVEEEKEVIMTNNKRIIYQLETLEDTDDILQLYVRTMNGKTMAIIPKEKIKVFETDTTYIIEFKMN